jgi:hypothetical protein
MLSYLLKLSGIEGGGKRRQVEGVNSKIIYLIHCKRLCECRCHNVPPLSTTIKEKN